MDLVDDEMPGGFPSVHNMRQTREQHQASNPTQGQSQGDLLAQAMQQITLLQNRLNTIETSSSARSSNHGDVLQQQLLQALLNQSTRGHGTGEGIRRKRLPVPERFDGEDRARFPTFMAQLDAKLEQDGDLLGNEKAKVQYMFGQLAGKAAQQLEPWYPKHRENLAVFTVHGMEKQLRAVFEDRKLRERARNKMRQMHQGKRSLT